MSMYKNAAEPDATATLFGAADGHVLYEPAVLVGDATMWTYHVQLEANLKQQCGTTAEQIATLEYHLRLQASSPPTRARQLLTNMLWQKQNPMPVAIASARATVPTSSVAAAGASAAATGYTGMLPAQAAPPANDPPRQDRMGMAPRSGMPGMPRMPAAGTARGTSTGPSRAASPKRRRASCGRQSRWGAPSTRARGRGR